METNIFFDKMYKNKSSSTFKQIESVFEQKLNKAKKKGLNFIQDYNKFNMNLKMYDNLDIFELVKKGEKQRENKYKVNYFTKKNENEKKFKRNTLKNFDQIHIFNNKLYEFVDKNSFNQRNNPK